MIYIPLKESSDKLDDLFQQEKDKFLNLEAKLGIP